LSPFCRPAVAGTATGGGDNDRRRGQRQAAGTTTGNEIHDGQRDPRHAARTTTGNEHHNVQRDRRRAACAKRGAARAAEATKRNSRQQAALREKSVGKPTPTKAHFSNRKRQDQPSPPLLAFHSCSCLCQRRSHQAGFNAPLGLTCRSQAPSELTCRQVQSLSMNGAALERIIGGERRQVPVAVIAT
jgi:hypothetical protein